MKHWVSVMNESRVGQYMDAVEKDMVSRYIPPEPHMVLDIGGGTGRWSDWLQANDYPQVLMDLDRGALRETQVYSPKLVMAQANAEKIPAATNSAQTVIAVQLFGSLSNRPAFLKECYRILKPNGLLFISWSNKNSIKGWLFKTYSYFKGTSTEEQYNFYATSHQENVAMLTDAGFEILDAIGYSWTMLPRGHNSFLVDVFVGAERTLRLNTQINISPNVMLATRKPAK